MSALDKFKRSQISGLPPRQPPSGLASRNKKIPQRKRDYTPVSWEQYFQEKHDIEVGENIFRVYECGEEGPVTLFLHGGGFSGLSWAVLSSCLSSLVMCRCAAIDLRGHGDSMTTDDSELSTETMSTDVGEVIKALYGDDPPPIVLVGHSMGGAIAIHVAEKQLIPSLVGLIVIDVVEGTALDSLASMDSFLRGRPKQFSSLENAIEWCVRTGQVRNVDSAKVSMVGQVKRMDTEETATSELEHNSHNKDTEPASSRTLGTDTIMEEEEDDASSSTDGSPDKSTSTENGSNGSAEKSDSHKNSENAQNAHPSENSTKYIWRIDLSKTEKYWKGWFEGLSNRFLSCSVPKMLLLAGIDRLDKDLTVGQMQGKFQMQVLSHCGHVVHEDVPDKVADVLATFLIRHKFASSK